MLRISEQKAAWTIRQFYASRRYYEQALGIVGVWGGIGAERLGLRGTVTRTELDWLCENMHPVNGQKLTARMQPGRTVAYTFRFSPCKSVSLLYGLYRDKALLEAFRTAVIETMQEMEAEMKTRLRKGGQQAERVTGNMVWGEFIHTVATPVDGRCDPQLHAYLPVFNATWDEVEERWKAGWFQDLVRDAPYFEAVFRSRVAHELGVLGLQIRKNGKDFEIEGVLDETLQKFSRRTGVVEAETKKQGRTKGRLGAKTRERAVPRGWTLDSMRTEWAERLMQSESDALAMAYRSRVFPADDAGRLKQIVDNVLCRYAGRGKVFERRLISEMCFTSLGEVSVEAIRRELASRSIPHQGKGRDCVLLL